MSVKRIFASYKMVLFCLLFSKSFGFLSLFTQESLFISQFGDDFCRRCSSRERKIVFNQSRSTTRQKFLYFNLFNKIYCKSWEFALLSVKLFIQSNVYKQTCG